MKKEVTNHNFRGNPQADNRLTKLSKYRRLLVLMVMFIGVLGSFFIQLVFANGLATRSGEINSLEREKSALHKELALLNEERNQLCAVDRIIKLATEELGLSYQTSQFEYLTNKEYAYEE